MIGVRFANQGGDMLKDGFYTAVGTPLDDSGNILVESLGRQIEDQIAVGASGILIFGTMGMGGCIKTDQYEAGIEAAVAAVGKRCALLVGASDNSVGRMADKLAVTARHDIDGVVVTAPYYFKTGDASLLNFFETTAGLSEKDYYLYDHEPITKHKITFDMVKKLMEIPNVKGIKSGDLVLIKHLSNYAKDKDFAPVFSGSDLFDVAHAFGITRYLDGIFACMPKSIGEAQRCFNQGDATGARSVLRNMMQTRDIMLGIGIWPSFTHAMNLLGYEGNFAPDYELDISDADKKATADVLKRLGEL